uniref:Uncharacterized protein n=1 Tax=Onchocerca volvulus TaxID=6282 RepID=A0A8R1Y3V8_ONCVO
MDFRLYHRDGIYAVKGEKIRGRTLGCISMIHGRMLETESHIDLELLVGNFRKGLLFIIIQFQKKWK